MSDAWRGKREWCLPFGGGWGTGKESEVEGEAVWVWWEY